MSKNPSSNLIEAVVSFVEKYPKIKDFSTGNGGSYLEFKIYIDLFIENYPEFEASLLCLYGQRTFLKNRAKFFDECEVPNPSHTIQDFCILTKDYFVISLGAKIFDTTHQEFFTIKSIEEVSKEWLVMATNLGSIEHLDQLEHDITQMSKEWQSKAFPSLSDEEIEKRIAEAILEGRMCYRHVWSDIDSGNIAFSGNKENNIYIQKMNGLYKDIFSQSKRINMNEIPTKQTEPVPFSLVGKYFHVFGENGNIDLQGTVVGMITDQYALVQYFDWVLGQKSTMEILPIPVMAVGATFNKSARFSFQFYETLEAMNNWYKHHRPGVGI